MVQPSLSIIESTGPFFAIALLVAVLLRASAHHEADVAPEAPPPGRFSATVLHHDSAMTMEGDASFRLGRSASNPQLSVTPDEKTTVSLAADARFSPAFLQKNRGDAAPDASQGASQDAGPETLPDSLQADSLAGSAPSDTLPAEVQAAPSAPSAGPSSGEPSTGASTQPPHLTFTIPIRMSEGDAFVLETPDDESPPPNLRYFPSGLCSIPYEMIRGTTRTVREDGQVQGRVRGTLRRVDVYRPADSLDCARPSLVPTDPSATLDVDVRFEAM
jgi:hypothetical protein